MRSSFSIPTGRQKLEERVGPAWLAGTDTRRRKKPVNPEKEKIANNEVWTGRIPEGVFRVEKRRGWRRNLVGLSAITRDFQSPPCVSTQFKLPESTFSQINVPGLGIGFSDC
ncbi:hypothetical protein ATANTOWER_005850 [Ataeniobius toweri]|uniref:Uncharacterized protein n=1 Tax=Ataeniobius toweri TaxID=208326 RepID=A0ABU7AW88_9TELE|nr:hypothetical protein [Ataeniobius toweri]